MTDIPEWLPETAAQEIDTLSMTLQHGMDEEGDLPLEIIDGIAIEMIQTHGFKPWDLENLIKVLEQIRTFYESDEAVPLLDEIDLREQRQDEIREQARASLAEKKQSENAGKSQQASIKDKLKEALAAKIENAGKSQQASIKDKLKEAFAAKIKKQVDNKSESNLTDWEEGPTDEQLESIERERSGRAETLLDAIQNHDSTLWDKDDDENSQKNEFLRRGKVTESPSSGSMGGSGMDRYLTRREKKILKQQNKAKRKREKRQRKLASALQQTLTRSANRKHVQCPHCNNWVLPTKFCSSCQLVIDETALVPQHQNKNHHQKHKVEPKVVTYRNPYAFDSREDDGSDENIGKLNVKVEKPDNHYSYSGNKSWNNWKPKKKVDDDDYRGFGMFGPMDDFID